MQLQAYKYDVQWLTQIINDTFWSSLQQQQF